MTIGIFTPYGTFSQESGLLILLARYLHAFSGKSVEALLCNGAFSVCDRDEESNWSRKVSSCAECIFEQRSLSQWAGIKTRDLTQFLKPDEIRETENAHQSDLKELPEIIKGSFLRRYSSFDPNHRGHHQIAKRLVVSAERMKMAMQNYIQQASLSYLCISGGGDFLTQTARQVAEELHVPCSVFVWSLEDRGIRIFHPRKKAYLSCALMIPDARALRTDLSSWSAEVVGILKEITEFLEFSAHQQ